MAITLSTAYFLLRLKHRAFRDNHVSLMDIGEQNWFGSTSLSEVVNVAKQMGVPPGESSAAALERADDADQNPFDVAKIFYRHLLGVDHYEAIDLHGTKAARKINLNMAFEPERQFDVVLNIGTTEHVFNQFEAFNTIHKLCRTGGHMVHGLPLSGGREHGFFNYHVTTFFDLCGENGYVMSDLMWSAMKEKEGGRVIAAVESFTDRMGILKFLYDLPLGTEGINVCLQKTSDAPFRCPMQGYYDSHLNSEERAFMKDFWKRHR